MVLQHIAPFFFGVVGSFRLCRMGDVPVATGKTDWADFDIGVVVVTDVGPERMRVAALLAKALGLSPADALRRLNDSEIVLDPRTRQDARPLLRQLGALQATAEFRALGPDGGPLLGDLKPHAMGEILAYFRNGYHNEELDHAFLHPVDQRDVPYGLDDQFFLLPDWEHDDDADAEAFAARHSLSLTEGVCLGQQLADVLLAAREQAGDHATDDQLLAAYNHYLAHDDFLDLA